LSIVRYCSVITTIAAAAAVEATVELVSADGTTTGRKGIELSIPFLPGSVSDTTEADLAAVGVADPAVDEDEE
jgi:hypothetical protein